MCLWLRADPAQEVLGVQCRLGEGRAVQVVLRVMDWKREGEVETSKGMMTWLTG